jgi:hypothetical protein
MTGPIAICIVALTILIAHEWKLFSFLRYLRKSEHLRIRLSHLRHKVVMYAGSGKMQPSERRAIEFLYNGATFPLRCPFLYRDISSMVVVSFMDENLIPPPKVKKGDFSARTRPMLKEFASISEDLANRFAHPIFNFLTLLSGRQVLDMAREMETVSRLRQEAKKRRELMMQWKDCATAMAA